MYKQSLEKADEQEIKLSTFVGSWIKQQNYRKTSTSASLTTLNLCAGMHAKSLQLCLTLLQPHGLQSARLLCPWDSPGKNTGVGYHALLQGNLSISGIKHMSLMSPVLADEFFTTGANWECVDNKKQWKILKEMGIPDRLTCLLRNLYLGKKQQLEWEME